jgi:hypothetical protein
VGLTTPRLKKKLVKKGHKGPRTWKDSLDKRRTLKKMDMRFGTWNIRGLYIVGCDSCERNTKYKLDLVGV